jgi:small multidrug resistance pump
MSGRLTQCCTSFYLLLAILLEVAGTTAMKISDGFTYWLPSLLIFVFYSLSLIFLALTLRRLEVSLAYAIWSGLGTVLLAVIGALFFAEPLTVVKTISLSFIVVGVVGLRLT